MEDTKTQVTQLLLSWNSGDADALDKLVPIIEGELRKIAKHYMKKERSDHTLQPTALVHEVYIRLVNRRKVTWKNRAHFLGTAAQMMRRILVDHARKFKAQSRGEGQKPLAIDEVLDEVYEDPHDLVHLDDALKALEKENSRASQTIVLHYFAGLTQQEISEILGVSQETVRRDQKTARVWLFMYMKRNGAR